MILLDAIYINQSGGKVLLEYFLKKIKDLGLESDFFFLLDNRIEAAFLNEINKNQAYKINASEISRRSFYKKMSSDFTHIFCFANVPPPIKLKHKNVFVLFHNALIIENKNMNYNLKSRFIFFLKKLYIKNRELDTYKWVVQTKKMSELLSEKLNIQKQSIAIFPFYEENRFENINHREAKNNGEFLYIADGVKQKNHQILLDAWEMIFDNDNLPITLHLTVQNEFESLVNEINRLQKKGVSIVNHGRCNHEKIEELYKNCNFFIMPSLTESFGLPLIEAAEAGCEIIAADLEYVYEIVKPLAVFDPHNKQDIANVITSAFLGCFENKTKIVVKNKIYDLIKLVTDV